MFDEELQSTPYEIKPGEPRLTGLLAFNGLLVWKVRRTGDMVELVIDARSMRGQINYLTALAIAFPVFALVGFLGLGRPGNSLWGCLAFLAGGVLIGLSMLVVARWIQRSFQRNMQAGPVVRFRPGGDLDFPRFGRTVPRADAIRWEVVTGSWLRAHGPYGSITSHEQTWELQLIYRAVGGEMAQPVFASQGRIKRIAQELADASGIPLRHVQEPLGFFGWRKPIAPNSPPQSK